MFKKLAYSQRVLRALAGGTEKQAGIMLPLAIGAGVIGGAALLKKGLNKGKEFKAGFQPGVAETRFE